MAYLVHHGILGQKWGKRNGPPYPLESGDHSKSEQKAGWRKSLNKPDGSKKKPGKLTAKLAKKYESEYKNSYGGYYTKETAKKAGMDKAEIMKRVAIGAGVVVGVGIAAYVYREYGREFADGIISSGTTIQTLSVDPDRMDKGLAFYTAYTEADKVSYKAFFGIDRYTGENKEIIQALVNKDIRIAGENTGKQVFDKLMKTDREFARSIRPLLREDFSHMPYVKNDYDKFNVGLPLESFDFAHEKFYKALKELGYGAVADVNDRNNANIKSYAAIIFDRSDIMRTSVSHLSNEMIFEAGVKDEMRKLMNMLVSPEALLTYGGGAIGIASSVADKRNASKYKKKKDSK